MAEYRDADERSISRTDRNARSDLGLSVAGSIAFTARTDAAQYFRTALPCDGRRGVARRPPIDRNDPARRCARRRGRQAVAIQDRLCVTHYTVRRERRWPLSH